MTRRSSGLLAVALVAVAAAVLLVMLARGVGEAEARIESGQIQAAAALDRGAARAGFAAEIVEPWLGVDDDARFQQALGLVERSAGPDLASQEIVKLHAEAIARLGPIVAGDGEAPTRSRAAGLIGALYAADVQLDPNAGARYLEQSVKALRLAAKLDPTNEDAKLNLELVLAAEVSGNRPGAGASEGSGFSSGAGSGGSGSGY